MSRGNALYLNLGGAWFESILRPGKFRDSALNRLRNLFSKSFPINDSSINLLSVTIVYNLDAKSVVKEPTEEKRAVNALKTEFLHNFIYKSSSYLTGNTLRLHYKAQPVNAVWGNSRCLL
jgi:hypothetical protein